jgi:hypothetical protein
MKSEVWGGRTAWGQRAHFREIDLSAFRNSRKEGTDMENAKPRRGRGRPSRAEASAKALAALQAAGIDPASIDPRAVLAAVAADASASASARVSAARALLADAQDREIREANDAALADWEEDGR